MTVAEYLKATRLRQYELALLADLSPAMVCQLVKGGRRPSREAAARLHAASDGLISYPIECLRDIKRGRKEQPKGKAKPKQRG